MPGSGGIACKLLNQTGDGDEWFRSRSFSETAPSVKKGDPMGKENFVSQIRSQVEGGNCPSVQMLSDFQAGYLEDSDQRTLFAWHIARCQDCQLALARLEKFLSDGT